jgi:hypothetical protein
MIEVEVRKHVNLPVSSAVQPSADPVRSYPEQVFGLADGV